MPDLSIIIVAYNVTELVGKCLQAVAASKDHLAKEVIYVDNGSTDGTSDMVRKRFPEVEIIQSPTNLGFIRANNLAFAKAHGEFILMLNSDAFVGESTLQRTVDFMKAHPECGALGCRLVGSDGKLQPSVRYFHTPWNIFLLKLGWKGPWWKVDDLDWPHDQIRECDWVTGCYLLTRKDIIERLGFFLREDFFMYSDDIDLCLRIKRLGKKIFFYPETVVHLGGANSKKIEDATKQRLIEKYMLESQYIYFRRNYHIHYVLAYAGLMSLFEIVEIMKGIVFLKRRRISEAFRQLDLVYSILFQTHCGAEPIH